MNILFLSQRLPYPPNKGDKLRSYNQIKCLSRQHQVSLICLTDDQRDMEFTQELSTFCRSVKVIFIPKYRSKAQSLFALLSSKPLTLSYFYSAEAKSVIERTLREESFDVVFVYCSSMAQYVEQVHHIPKVIDFVDVDSEKWIQYAAYAAFPMKHLYQIESSRLRKYEARLARIFQHCFLVSEKETEDFKTLVHSSTTVTPIQNGVDADFFKPSDVMYEPYSLVFTGVMDYFANVGSVLYFVEEILPLIRKEIPSVKFYVVGNKPAKEVRALQEIHPDIVVTGYVESVIPYVSKSAVFVAPMVIARGVQNKILEAMAMGVPVVTTSRGFEGITAIPGKDIFVEDEPEGFAGRVIRLLEDIELRRVVSKRGRSVVEERYDWRKNLQKLESTLVSITSGSIFELQEGSTDGE